MESSSIAVEPAARPASRVNLAAYYAQDLARSAARMLLRRVRSRDRVAAEYHLGHWHRMLLERPWLAASSLAHFLEGDDATVRLAKVGGRIVEIPTREYYRLRMRALADLVAAQAGDAGEIVELGCGFGYNLFSLAACSHRNRYMGFDISENAIGAARAIAGHFGLDDRMRFDLLDLTDAAHPHFREIRAKTVFTYMCIEQVPRAVESVIQCILQQRPKRVIHVEPTTELLQIWRPMDLLNYAYVKSVDYQTRLFTVIDELARRGDVRVLTRQRVPWAPTLHNDSFVITWEPL